MKLTDKISLSFAVYGLICGVILAIAVTVAFYIVEDAILDTVLLQAVGQVNAMAAQNAPVFLPQGTTLLTENLPAELLALPEGRHEVSQYRHVAVFPHPLTGQTLYLVLDETEAGFDVLLSRLLFGTLIALISAVFIGVLFSRFVSRQLMRPMNQLVERIEKLDIANPTLEPLASEDEIGFLSGQFSTAVKQLGERDRRERDFTRFASHELRSPITVLSGTTSILKSEKGLTERAQRALSRSEEAVTRMARLVDAFLFLGRSYEACSRNTVTSGEIASEIRRLTAMQADSGNAVDLSLETTDGTFVTNPQLLSIVLENLIANAARHGQGDLRVTVAPPEIVLINTIADTPDPGHGFGLEIAARICERLDIDLRIDADAELYEVRLLVNEEKSEGD